MTHRLIKASSAGSVMVIAMAMLAMPAAAQYANPYQPQPYQGQQGQATSYSQQQPSNVDVTPYLELGQVFAWDIDGADFPGQEDFYTYTSIAAGVDASASTGNFQGTASLRYEHRFHEAGLDGDEDIFSGLANARLDLVDNVFAIEAGGLATLSNIDVRGPTVGNLVGATGNEAEVYSAYIGPRLTTNIGQLGVSAAYDFGYAAVSSDAPPLFPGEPSLDLFDDSTSHNARASIGMDPGALPFGWTASGQYLLENSSQLDQKLQNWYGRFDLVVPVSRTFALVGGVGYEDVEVSERDALRDNLGNPVVGDDGRFVTDPTSPRLLSYDYDGIMWDAGILWRPSNKTSLEARVGERYGSTTYYGSFTYAPNERTAILINAYDQLQGFGTQLNQNVAGLGTNFEVNRNPITGDIDNCIFGGNGGCVNNGLTSLASPFFRSRGINGQFSTTSYSGWRTGFGLGYNRNTYIASQLGALAAFDGAVEETVYGNIFASKQLSQISSIDLNLYANYFDSDLSLEESWGLGGNASYNHNFTERLRGSVALGLDYFDPVTFEDDVLGSAYLGLRYSF